jgi:hypothetical protein
VLVSRTRPLAHAAALAEQLDAELLPMGSAGAKAMAVVLGEAEGVDLLVYQNPECVRLGINPFDQLIETLRVGDPFDEVLGAWVAKEAVRAIYLEDDSDAAGVLLDNTIAACLEDPVEEIRTLGRTVSRHGGRRS